MDLADFIPELPITLANYHSSTVCSVPLVSLRTRTIYEHDYLDAGGSGVYIHRPDKYTVKSYKLKRDSLVGSPFYPKCFTLPLIIPKRKRIVRSVEFEFNSNHFNSLQYDKKLECFFYADPIKNKITLQEMTNDPGDIRSTTTELSKCYLSFQSGPINEITPSFYYQSQTSTFFLARQPHCISVIKMNKEEDDKITCNPEPIDFNYFDNEMDEDQITFWKISKSHLLDKSVAIGLYKVDGTVQIKDYDLETRQFRWAYASKIPTPKQSVNTFWTQDHPKLLAYCELDHFSLLDTRDADAKSMKSIMKFSNLKYVRDWERFRGACQLSITDSQFLLALDHKLILVDRRFPQKNLLQWNHMLPCDETNHLRFLSSTTVANNGSSIITLANKNQICLITVDHFDINITQPQSLHFPMHLSQPVDSWHFSSNVDQSARQRLESLELTGLCVQPNGDDGYSVCQATSGGDLWVQNFFPKESVEPDQRVTWKRNCCSENPNIEPEIYTLLDETLSKFSSKRDIILKPEQGTHFQRPIIKINEPEMIMQLPVSNYEPSLPNENGYQIDNIDEPGPYENLITKRLNLLVDTTASSSENEYTLKLLSKWRDDES